MNYGCMTGGSKIGGSMIGGTGLWLVG